MVDHSPLHVPTDAEVVALEPAQRAEMAAGLLEGIDPNNHRLMIAELAAACLGKLEPGRQPFNLFMEISRITVASTVEFVPIRERNDELQVWLEKRSGKNDPFRGKWVLPGVRILDDDPIDEERSLRGPIKRLFKDELSGIQLVGDIHQLPSQYREEARGKEVTEQFVGRVETGSKPYPGKFFNSEELTSAGIVDDILEEGWLTMQRAFKYYKEHIAA
jgi:hypothetical protein